MIFIRIISDVVDILQHDKQITITFVQHSTPTVQGNMIFVLHV